MKKMQHLVSIGPEFITSKVNKTIMPIMKTQSSAKKRFKKTASGKIKKKNAFMRHLMANKTTKQKRHLRQAGYIASVDQARIAKLLP